MKLWEKKLKLNKEIEEFTVGNDFLLDKKLIKYDCIASIAHAIMLKKKGLLNKKECSEIINALNEIIKLDKQKKFKIKKEDEDCHTSIENFLVKKLSKTGKKIHALRSRNDQVLTALRLYYKNEIKDVIKLIDALIKELFLFKKKYGKIAMPGYTHMQKAVPSSAGLWSQAFIESMQDNKKLIFFVNKLLDQSPLGTGAGYNLPVKTDRKLTKKLLGFKKIQNNSIYVQNSRGKFESIILNSLNQVMFDLNKISSDMLLFNMSEFGFIELNKEICTGSSIMPHKKNPDALEIVRAKYYENLAFEFQIKNIIGNLISGYNRDFQLTKEPVIKGFNNTKNCLKIIKIVLNKTKVNKENCSKGITKEMHSVKEIHKLVKQGIPFREAYKKIKQN